MVQLLNRKILTEYRFFFFFLMRMNRTNMANRVWVLPRGKASWIHARGERGV